MCTGAHVIIQMAALAQVARSAAAVVVVVVANMSQPQHAAPIALAGSCVFSQHYFINNNYYIGRAFENTKDSRACQQ